eukprot:TRINITY_DN3932_c0_g1_i1.p1 TRINITY_DN3932_c0_g1~~TRINITY_DN3932_c0_g1_i1.p1  ORF type:complete len:281 (-),score=27.80 TRINITY_DN3932_c0_g1_i1:169-1011(-)
MLLISPHISDFLHGIDIASLQTVDTLTRGLVARGEIWLSVVKRELPQLVVDQNLVKSFRPLVLRCFGILRRSVLSANCVLRINSESELMRLERCLLNAAQAAANHMASGGREVHLLVGDFNFKQGAQTTRFPFVERKDSLCGLPSGELGVKMCIVNGEVWLGALYRQGEGNEPVVFVGHSLMFKAKLTSVNASMCVSFRGASLKLDGRVSKVPGALCSEALLRATQQQTDTSVLCVAALLDAQPEEAPIQPRTPPTLSSLFAQTRPMHQSLLTRGDPSLF